jgi:transposase InsO family protein
MNIAVAPTAQGEETLVRLIRNEFGVELMALDDARASGDSPAGQLVTLEELCRFGRPAATEEAAKTRAVDALSGPEKRAFTRRVSLITHCDRLFIEAAKGAKKRDIFKQAALAEFDEGEKPANVGPAKEQPFTWRTVGVLWRKYVDADRDSEALKPRFCDRGQRRQRKADPLAALIHKTLSKRWRTGKLSIGAVRTHVAQAIAQSVDGRLLGRTAPSERTIYREIMRDKVFRQHMLEIHGKRLVKPVGWHEPVERPLDEVQVDEMFLAAEIAAALGVGKETAVSVLFCVDTCSGAPLGLNLGIGAADAERARLLMLHAISPKPAIVLANGATVSWAHGLPRLVKADNGSIIRTDEFVLPLTDLNIMVRHTPPYSPWLKGVIENFNHLVKWWVKRYPLAKLTLEALQRLLELMIAKRLLRERRGRGEAPIDCFERLNRIHKPRPPDLEQLLTLGKRDRAKFDREGVSYHATHFRARRPDDFLKDPRNWGREYEIRIHPQHFDYILMLLPEGRWIRLDRADQPDAAGRSLAEFDALRRQQAETARNNGERQAQQLAIEEEASRLGRDARPQPVLKPQPAPVKPLSPPSLWSDMPLVIDDDDQCNPLKLESP